MYATHIIKNTRDKTMKSLLYIFNIPRTFRSGCDPETVNACLVNSTHASRMVVVA